MTKRSSIGDTLGDGVDEDLLAGCVRFLREQADVLALVGIDDNGDPLIVQDIAPAREEWPAQTIIVVSYLGTEGSSERGTFEQWRIQLEFWVAPYVDGDGSVQSPTEARQRLVACYKAADRAMHRTLGGPQNWGAVRTIDSTRRAGLRPYQVPGSEGLWRGTAIYAVTEW